jgi:hypothetical protein
MRFKASPIISDRRSSIHNVNRKLLHLCLCQRLNLFLSRNLNRNLSVMMLRVVMLNKYP